MEKNLGHATAYGYAKSKGYSGTEEEFAELMADYASVGQSAAQSAEQAAASATSASGSATTASQAAQTATSKASEAVTAAGTATTKASEASTSADTASAAATSASTSAQTATTAASTATTKASEAAVSANTATTAKTDAETARDAAAQSASEAAESARTLTIDATLTQSGQAADAKVVGDEIEGIKDDLDDIAEIIEASSNLFTGVYETGKSLNADGSVSDSADRAVSEFIPVDANTTYYAHYGATQGLVNFIRVNCYDANKSTVLSTAINTNTFSTPANTAYVRICSAKAYFDLYYALTATSAAEPYEEYRPEAYTVKTDDTLTNPYMPAQAKATGNAIAALEDNVNATVASFSDYIDYIDNLKTNVYVREEPVNLMPSIQTETNILADGTTESNSSYAVSSKFALKPGKKIVFTRQMTQTTRGVERFKVVFFNNDTVVNADVAMSDLARTVPSAATHAIVGFYNSYATDNYAPMVEYGDGTTVAQEYSSYFVPYDLYKPSVTQRNTEKKLCVFGDSLAANGNGGNDYWAHIVGTTLGFAEIYNRGVGSSRVANTATLYAWVDADGDSYNRGAYETEPTGVPSEYNTQIDACMSGNDRALTIPTDTDVLLILAGANDASTIGTIGIDVFKTAYRTMLDKIYDRVPDAKVYLCTPPFNANWDLKAVAETYNSIRTAVVGIGQEYGFPVIDLKGEMMVNKNNYSTYMNTDGVHFNTANGRKITADAVVPHLYGIIY